MRRELKTYQWRCDRCPAEAVVQGFDGPEGWSIRTSVLQDRFPFESFLVDLCPACAAAHRDERTPPVPEDP